VESLIPRGNTTQDVEFSEQLQRTAEWLNSLPLARLDREREGGSIADRAFAICQEMIRETESILGLPERQLPRLRAHGAGSQLAVVGQELSEVMASVELDRINSDLAFMRFISAFISLRRTGAQR
jgi:hypothetical protein